MTRVEMASMHHEYASFHEGGPPFLPVSYPLSCAPSDTIILVDWDDTLLPTTFLKNCGLLHSRVVPDEVAAALEVHAAKVEELIRTLETLGRVAIVTGAGGDWVEHTNKTFLKISNLPPAVSARSVYGYLGEDPLRWKEAAFRAAIASAPTQSGWKNVVSIGDAYVEAEALRRACSCSPHTIPKTLKMLDQPDLWQLTQELALICSRLDSFVSFGGPLHAVLHPEEVAHFAGVVQAPTQRRRRGRRGNSNDKNDSRRKGPRL
eukprot:CAMPEP_0204502784 /NCGR_PEP_ID=MMETSP0471-20130131/101994_1 /ASSEMBLY_ACC=CAM_ASM_000602 /TAXON_ID=2969 /ORGANISM="Oxyrrhis marina" /LENGTH=261 /DNA_ID=CAMNT_0051507559 /DNA_START=11 /DNA_END=796 /DNA_ORIENTATION=+